MSITLHLEIEDIFQLSDIESCFGAINVEDVEYAENEVSAYLPDTNATVVVEVDPGDMNIVAEGAEAGWNVGIRMHFHVDPTRPDYLLDVKSLLDEIATVSRAKFVLSLHYETIFAKRGEEGLIFVREM